jgi:hypothetical protein
MRKDVATAVATTMMVVSCNHSWLMRSVCLSVCLFLCMYMNESAGLTWQSCNGNTSASARTYSQVALGEHSLASHIPPMVSLRQPLDLPIKLQLEL